MTTSNPLSVGTKVLVVKGSNRKGVNKGVSAVVTEVKPLGAEYNHNVNVVLRFLNGFVGGKTMVFCANHQNRLSDPVVRLFDSLRMSHIEVVAR